MSRRPTSASLPAALAVLALLVAGCGDDDPETQPSSGPTCSGGDVRFLQGQPAQLPGGGSGGIGQVRDTDPPTVNLSLGGADVQADNGLGVGDTFRVARTTYRITCISASRVTADEVA